MGFKSGEYGGRYLIRTPVTIHSQYCNQHRLKHVPKRSTSSRISSPWCILALSITRTLRGPGYAVHFRSCRKPMSTNDDYELSRLTTINSRYSKNSAFVIDPSTTVPAKMPSKVSRASVDVRRPQTNGCFFSACLPLTDLPYRLPIVRSSFDVSSRNPSSSGLYCTI